MRPFLKIISYIFHPLFMPLAGTLAYFIITPKYSPIEVQSGNILPIFILTVIIPIIFYLILHNLGVVHSIFIPDVKERLYPVLIHIVLLFLIVLKVIPNNYVVELHFYFIGLIISAMVTLLFILIGLKVSMHLMGMGSLLMFLLCLSVHFEKNITLGLSLLTLATGLVATARLYLKAHSKPEVLIGFFIGLISQILTVRYWL